MKVTLDNLKKHYKKSNLESRLLVVSMFSGMVICFTSAILNMALNMDMMATTIPSFMGLLYIYFIYAVVVKDHFKLAAYGSLLFLSVLVLPMMWITSGGLKGSIPYYYILMIFLTTVVLNKIPYKYIISLQIFILICLIYIDIGHPELIHPYESYNYQLFDMSYSLILIIFLVFFLIRYIMKKYNQSIRELRNTKAQLEKANEILHHAAITDSLTSLYNRRYIEEIISRHVSGNTSINSTAVMVDIDFFKSINDTFGHDVGDYVLTEISSIFKDNLPSTSHIARIGGEEFLIILENTSLENSTDLCQNMRQVVEYYRFSPHDFRVTISIGIYGFNQNDSTENIFRRADEALYISKNSGRNKISLWKES